MLIHRIRHGRRVPDPTTPTFKRWWAAGVLTNPDGSPRRFFHGTPWPGFKRFSLAPHKRLTSNETRSLGIFFTSDPEVANDFTETLVRAGYLMRGNRRWEDGDPKLYPHMRIRRGAIYTAFLNLQNPKVYTSDTEDDAFRKMMDDRDAFADYIGGRGRGNWPRGYWRRRVMARGSEETNRLFRASLAAEGFDGILLQGTEFDGILVEGEGSERRPHDVVIAFDPKQIRTA